MKEVVLMLFGVVAILTLVTLLSLFSSEGLCLTVDGTTHCVRVGGTK